TLHPFVVVHKIYFFKKSGLDRSGGIKGGGLLFLRKKPANASPVKYSQNKTFKYSQNKTRLPACSAQKTSFNPSCMKRGNPTLLPSPMLPFTMLPKVLLLTLLSNPVRK